MISAAVFSVLILGASVARANEGAPGADTADLVQQMVADGGYDTGLLLASAGPPGKPPGLRPGHGRRHGDKPHEEPGYQPLGSYPQWFRFHHRYGYDYPRRHSRWPLSHRPHDGYGIYISGPWGAIGYWENGVYYGYVPFGYRDDDLVLPRPPSNRYTGGDGYHDYIVVESPTVPEPTPVAPAVPAERPQPVQSGQMESALSPMLGGPPRVALAFALGEVGLKAGRPADAVTAFRQALRGSPGDPTVRLALALALTAEGDHTSAAEMVKLGLVGVAKADELTVDGVAVFGSAEALDAMIAKVQAAAEREDGADVQLALGFLCFATGRFATARDALWAAYEDTGGSMTVGRLLLAAERRLRAEPQPVEEATDEVAEDQ
jgi:Flp pilus assembly protein TadD